MDETDLLKTQFINWFDDERIKEFELSLDNPEVTKFKPYMTMFHTLKLEYKRLVEEHDKAV